MLATTKATALKPCKFYCEGRTCKFGEHCKFLHDDSLRATAIEKRNIAGSQKDMRNQPTNAHQRQSRWPKKSELRALNSKSPKMLGGWEVKEHEECLWTRDALNNMKVIGGSLPVVGGTTGLQRSTTQGHDFTTQPAKELNRKGFQLFSELPVELRLLIWKLALQDGVHASVVMKELPNTSTQSRDPSEISWDNDSQLNDNYTFIRRYAHPSLLHVCRESRELALEHYQLSFQGKIFFNYATDVIHLHSIQPHDIGRFVHACASENLYSIQRLAVNLRDTHVDDFVSLIHQFTGLKYLVIQFSYDDSEEYRGSRGMIVETAHLIRMELKAGGKHLLPRYKAPRIQVVTPEHVEFP